MTVSVTVVFTFLCTVFLAVLITALDCKRIKLPMSRHLGLLLVIVIHDDFEKTSSKLLVEIDLTVSEASTRR